MQHNFMLQRMLAAYRRSEWTDFLRKLCILVGNVLLWRSFVFGKFCYLIVPFLVKYRIRYDAVSTLSMTISDAKKFPAFLWAHINNHVIRSALIGCSYTPVSFTVKYTEEWLLSIF